MKYVITMIDGEYQKPVLMAEFVDIKIKIGTPASFTTDGMATAWIQGKPFIDSTGIHFLIDLPA